MARLIVCNTTLLVKGCVQMFGCDTVRQECGKCDNHFCPFQAGAKVEWKVCDCKGGCK